MKLRTVEELYQEAQGTLREAGVDSPERDARALLREALRMTEADFLVNRGEKVPEPLAEAALALIARRALREPLPYLLGYTEFYGLRFACDSRALVPRPETEILVDAARGVCAGLAPDRLLVDVGTGTGILGVTLAVLHPELHLWATDVSREALALAAINARYHHLNGRLRLEQGPDLQPILQAGLADRVAVVVSNPPYVRSAELPTLQPEITNYEPRLALDGGPEGLDVYRSLLAACARLPRLEAVFLEIGADQGEAVTELAGRHLPQAAIQVLPDLAGLPRVVALTLLPVAQPRAAAAVSLLAERA